MDTKNKNLLLATAAAAVFGLAAVSIFASRQTSAPASPAAQAGQGAEASDHPIPTPPVTEAHTPPTVTTKGAISYVSHSSYTEEIIQPDPALTKRPEILTNDDPLPPPAIFPDALNILTQGGLYTYIQNLTFESYGQPVKSLTMTITSPAQGIVRGIVNITPSRVEETPGRYTYEFTNPQPGTYVPSITSKTKDVTISYSVVR